MSNTSSELIHFRSTLLQDIADEIETDRSGGIREEKFTTTILNYLDEAGETEGAVPCREIRENSIGNRIHKINGYAFSEGYETVDLFITVFKGITDIGRLYAEDIKTATNLATRFLQNLLSGKMEGVEETAPVFDFVRTFREIYRDIVRVNIYLLSDMQIPLEPPEQSEINGIRVHYHIRDIEYIYRIYTSGTGKQAIEIDFIKKFSQTLPCLSGPERNEDYESYLCVIPARMLADIYADHGARLLEQNVRTFLQFRGNINKGIRDTILKEPHMFMAYNNGISATAESVKLTDDKKSILSIKDFQIVNGGQTTASIFQTRRKYKTADLNPVSVQVKLTVIKDPKKKPGIVSLISRYANTQNKVSEADLSSNHPFHIELEYLSRKIWTSASPGKNQTRWYYERARGQYNDELSQIDKAAQQKKWLDRNPKNQKFAKEDLARFYISWEMQPWWVVRGRQRSFVEFMKIADDLDVTTAFYEDLIAKAIIFRTAERLYGAGAKAIGDLRYMVVPYSVAWLRFVTNNRINLLKIWKNQKLTTAFEKELFRILRIVDDFMRETAPGGLIGEWAKKEECWKQLKNRTFDTNFDTIKQACYSEDEFKARHDEVLIDELKLQEIEHDLRKLGVDGWIKIDQLGKVLERFSIRESNFIWKIINKLEKKGQFTNKELKRAELIMSIIRADHSQILRELESNP